MRRRFCKGVFNRLAALLCAAGVCLSQADAAPRARELSSEQVKDAIRRAQKFLAGVQNSDGSYGQSASGVRVGTTALALLALLNSGLPVDDPVVAAGLKALRRAGDPPRDQTYQLSLKIMALVAAKQWSRDKPTIERLAKELESYQVTNGPQFGMWSYGQRFGGGDNSNTQFAVLGLREAAIAGVRIKRSTWERIVAHFVETQNGDGGWSYARGPGSTGTMTCAGISSLVICRQMLGPEGGDVNPDGTPKCCKKKMYASDALRGGVQWLSRFFSARISATGAWAGYFAYGLERAGRLSGQRFFGLHDWYREGAEGLLNEQSQRDGSWTAGYGPAIDTSFALLFLSKGLAPVLINKLNYGGSQDNGFADDGTLPNWNLHPNDVRNLTEFISGRPHWPKLLTCQEVDLKKVLAHGSVEDLLQAPILYISGLDDPKFTDAQVQLLRSYVEQGGFIFAVNNCNGSGFDDGIRGLARRLYPDASLERLKPEHPIYRAEFPLDPEGVELLGVDFGCRTSFVYSPKDHSCLWDKWSPIPRHTAAFNALVMRSLHVGVNVVAYATGREPYDKLDAPREETPPPAGQDKIERSLLQVAKLRHTGDWDVAPRALRNMLIALNQFTGETTSTRQRNLFASDPNLSRYPLVYLHGRTGFQFNSRDLENLRKHLGLGAVLFADACCGSVPFDQSFREMVQQLYPGKKLKRIPITHELFSPGVGFDIRKVKRRIPASGNLSDPLDPTLREGEPFLEGIEINGRYCVIYSKYDLSCALERQASVACAGYDYHDAVRIAVNVVRYALLQDISYSEKIR